jgi:hypothetical protein
VISIQAAVKTIRHSTMTALLLFLLLLQMLVGCQNTPPPEAPAAPAPVEPKIDQEWLSATLAAAADAIERDQMTYPEEGSALSLYRTITARYPGQEDAKRGLEQIVEEYVALALEASERGQFATARSMLARARLILPEHPSIEPTTEQIRLLSDAERIRVILSQQDLVSQDRNTWAQLKDLGSITSERNCRYHIDARNDSQGRSIYQALSQGSEGARLKAQVKIRLPASVERVCFDAVRKDER